MFSNGPPRDRIRYSLESGTGNLNVNESGRKPCDGPTPILYYRNFCGFCRRVQTVMAQMGVEIEQRNIWENRDYERELVEATGRATVPVLRLVTEDGSSEWLPESLDIIRYLQHRCSG